MPSSSRIGVPWSEARQRLDQQRLLAKCRPIPSRIVQQRLGTRNPERTAPALEPVVEDDAGDLAALAAAGAVAQEPAAPEAHGIGGAVGCSGNDIEGCVDRPAAGELGRVGLARVDDALQLCFRQQALGEDAGWKVRSIGGLGRRDRGHRRRLHEPRRMRMRAGDADRLQGVVFVQHLAEPPALGRLPVHGLVGDLDGVAVGGRRMAPTAWAAAPTRCVPASAQNRSARSGSSRSLARGWRRAVEAARAPRSSRAAWQHPVQCRATRGMRPGRRRHACR